LFTCDVTGFGDWACYTATLTTNVVFSSGIIFVLNLNRLFFECVKSTNG